jgi:hypothetical protein
MTIDCRTETSGRLTQLLIIGPHTLRADMPIESGGDANGPGAHDFLVSDAQKSRLFEIAGRCPVHKLMTTATIDIRMTLI